MIGGSDAIVATEDDLTADIINDSFWSRGGSQSYFHPHNDSPSYKIDIDSIKYSGSNLLDIFSSNPSTVNMTDTGRGINRIDNFNEPFVQITYPRPQYLYNYTVEFHNTDFTGLNGGLNHWHIMGSNDGEAWDVLDIQGDKSFNNYPHGPVVANWAQSEIRLSITLIKNTEIKVIVTLRW